MAIQLVHSSQTALAGARAARVLIVDDDPDVRDHLRWGLMQMGFDVACARDGLAAFCEMEAALPSLVVTDIHMPRMDGLRLVDRMKQDQALAQIPVIALSGEHETRWKIAALDAGAADYLTKPVDIEELRARIGVQLRTCAVISQLRHDNTVDALTGVKNRRGIIEDLRRELYRASRTERGAGVMLIDVDEFKQINDTFGHIVGDRVLHELATKLARTVRKTDVVGRTGGDEFLVVFSEIDERQAGVLAGRLKEAAREVTVGPNGRPLSISVGFAITTSGSLAPETLVSRADRAMYADKDRRRALLHAA